MSGGELPSVVALGGGHGLSASLSALRQVTDQLTAVVTVADDGGSSGRLREEFGGLPPGDLRMALAALCGDDHNGRRWASVLQSRFRSEGPLDGHAVGNLLIEGVWQAISDPVRGLGLVGELVDARGRVLPASTEPLNIEADVLGLEVEFPNEVHVLRGQHMVASTNGRVQAIRLLPADPPACPQALTAIERADYIVLGPGSWFTSVLPHLLIPQLAAAIIASPAHKILTLNVTSGLETAGFSPSRHIELIAEHAPGLRLNTVVADEAFAASDAALAETCATLGADLVVDDVAMHDHTARHDRLRLAAVYRVVMGGAEADLEM
ncbi:uridine diphosphate-N-acetylglucosamine-binding protein YvcK [Propionibacterium freudenreichii]|uniref:gluconeogenesis factor YvcK family protein n=1 Tax=Propionibacterium freudenreichii TaxID=1744 RepID=UPI000BC35F0C|nr:uridine diphosphate-N-acetylglucosamine-binding protein YvcK [Propionibacterium freudenreichii]MDK9294015.1 uridine diphosphate-N-acetylglucosamine-binding protein YvcK [Propionibacterium freudenreichii]MDK9359404.1 uridine diphosphate-N-acetylglucosamine-binding protein YvcK [Propionibacterium freudenreichii]MDK9639313.1 uridine diphosphate-N-acetylglucosamine-binding protein YvcK [Propionibacterium freudenreichii]MDK9658855.1 uridine diphosphate-N-acetylglucosamine-binding protein YvcK [Pr